MLGPPNPTIVGMLFNRQVVTPRRKKRTTKQEKNLATEKGTINVKEDKTVNLLFSLLFFTYFKNDHILCHPKKIHFHKNKLLEDQLVNLYFYTTNKINVNFMVCRIYNLPMTF